MHGHVLRDRGEGDQGYWGLKDVHGGGAGGERHEPVDARRAGKEGVVLEPANAQERGQMAGRICGSGMVVLLMLSSINQVRMTRFKDQRHAAR